MPGNRDAFEVLIFSATQWRTGFNGTCGLDYTAVITIANALEIKCDRILLEKVRIYEKSVLENLKATAGQANALVCDDAQKKRCKIEHGEYLAWSCENCNAKGSPTLPSP